MKLFRGNARLTNLSVKYTNLVGLAQDCSRVDMQGVLIGHSREPECAFHLQLIRHHLEQPQEETDSYGKVM